MDFEKIADGIYKSVQMRIDAAISPLANKIFELEKQIVALTDIEKLVAAEIEKSVSAIPVPVDGKDCDMEAVKEMIVEQVKAIPAPKDGSSFTLEDAKPIIDKAVELICEDAEKAISDAVSAIPVPKDGSNGTSVTVDDVRPIIEAEIEKAVKQIPAPKDGLGMAGSMIDRDGNLIITMTNGETKNLGPVVGKDGLSMESFEMAYDADAHEVVLKAMAAGKSHEIRYPAGGIHGKGYWRDGLEAKAGEAWVQGGSLWIAKRNTTESPSHSSESWFMAVRKGRDGESVVRRVQSGPAQPIRLKDGGDDAGND